MDRIMAIISKHGTGALEGKSKWPFVVTLIDEEGNIFHARLETSSVERAMGHCFRFKIEGELFLWPINASFILTTLKDKDGFKSINNLGVDPSKGLKGKFDGWYCCKEGVGCITIRVSDLEI